MKTSELVAQLSQSLVKHGDLEVVYYDDRAGDYTAISYVGNPSEERYQQEDMEYCTGRVVELTK